MKTTIFQSDTYLRRDISLPLYRQIYQRFVKSITQGILQPEQRVPSIRTLSSELKVSRSTIELAYTLLIEEGYLEARGQAGTVVSSQIAGIHLKSPAILPPSEPETNNLSLFNGAASTQPQIYQLGLPALDLFPRKLWNTLIAKHIRLQSKQMFYPQATGYPPLQEAIASYLQLSRGISCAPQQVFITAGYRGALTLIGRTLLKPQDQVWLEDPCFPPGYHLLMQMGAEIVPIPVDQHGICVSFAQERAPDARLALVTPTHQSPLGVSLSMERRQALLAWAEQNNAFVIEDDYDSEFQYESRPQPSLASLRSENILYLGTFSKTLTPALRLAYLVVPPHLLPLFNTTCQIWHDGCPLLQQAVVADFIQEGHFTRHLRNMRTAYTQRRQIVTESLKHVFDTRLQFDIPASGLNLLARVEHHEDDIALAQRAREHQFGIAALSARSLGSDCGKGLLFGFANQTTQEEALKHAQNLQQCLYI
ncbi:PLP-dependent aminotransferase family protein [Xenorhabdus khoisanae]|uniref:MocR-like pyridoxine biosynthesis transcription factor PdxR n=1 Tax=Xenorhabdus khoisanae TaxID=880157 RepID=UPI002359C5FF|nr:PLP-dependent aminotransferase family protein [Xenorhabdus khoisanae]MDC9614511.1 PLP-dependent aminotransferase family protein [Xenorhabdus khoisanae]